MWSDETRSGRYSVTMVTGVRTCVTFVQCWTNVEDVGPICTNVIQKFCACWGTNLIEMTVSPHGYVWNVNFLGIFSDRYLVMLTTKWNLIVYLVVKQFIIYEVWLSISSTHQYFPSKHDTSTQCWYNLGASSTMLAQHWTNVGFMYRLCRELEQLLVVYFVIAYANGSNSVVL